MRAAFGRMISPPSAASSPGDQLEQGRFADAVAADQADLGAGRDRDAGAVEKAAAPGVENEIVDPKHAGIPNAAEMVGGGCGRFLSCAAVNGEGNPSSRRIADAGDFLAQDFKLQPLILRRRDLALQLAERRRRLARSRCGRAHRIADRRAWPAARSASVCKAAIVFGSVSSACLSLKRAGASPAGGPRSAKQASRGRFACVRPALLGAPDRRRAAPACRCSRRHIRASARRPPARSRRSPAGRENRDRG